MSAVQATVADWFQIISGEFQEIQGLHLTKPQVQRLWGLDAETCETLLEALVDIRFLTRLHDGTYVRTEAMTVPE